MVLACQVQFSEEGYKRPTHKTHTLLIKKKNKKRKRENTPKKAQH